MLLACLTQDETPQGQIQDFRFRGVEVTKQRALCAVILAMPIYHD